MNTKDYFIHTWKKEIKTTANAFNALPSDKLDYRPHPKTRSAKDIVEHLTPHAEAMIEAFEKGTIHHQTEWKTESIPQAVEHLNKSNARMEQAIQKVDEKTWNEKIIPFYIGENKVFEAPLRDMCYSYLYDMIHHRGQLSTYYRPMGVKNPSIYGPTAEMEEEMMVSQNS